MSQDPRQNPRRQSRSPSWIEPPYRSIAWSSFSQPALLSGTSTVQFQFAGSSTVPPGHRGVLSYSAVFAIDLLQSTLFMVQVFWSLLKNGSIVPGYANVPAASGVTTYKPAAIGAQVIEAHTQSEPPRLPNVVLEEGDSLAASLSVLPGSLNVVVANFAGWIYPENFNEEGVRGTLVDPQ